MGRYLDTGAPVNRSHPLAAGRAAWLLPVPGTTRNAAGVIDLESRSYFENREGNAAGPGFTKVSGPPGLVELGAWQFDGANDLARAPNTGVYQASARTTFACWVWVSTDPVSGQQFIGNIWSDEHTGAGGTTLQSSIWRLGSQGSTTFKRRIGINFNDGTDHDAQSSSDLTLQTWTHVAVVTTGAAARFYYNGVLVNSAAYAFTPRATSNTYWMFGAGAPSVTSGSNYRTFPGRLADLAYWPSRALSDADVRAWYDQSRRGHQDTLRRVTPRVSVSVPAAGGGGNGVVASKLTGRQARLAGIGGLAG